MRPRTSFARRSAEPPVVGLVIEAATNKLQTAFESRVTNENLNRVRDDFLTQPPIVVIGGVQDADRPIGGGGPRLLGDPGQLRLGPAGDRGRPRRRPGGGRTGRGLLSDRPDDRPPGHRTAATSRSTRSSRPGRCPASEGSQSGGLLAVLAAMVACLGFYLARFRQDFWARPRMAALLGLLVVLAAGAVRLTIEIQDGVGAPEPPGTSFPGWSSG